MFKSSKNFLTMDDISTGLLPEEDQSGDLLFSDWRFTNKTTIRKPTGELSLRDGAAILPPVENQFNTNSCTSCATSSMVEFASLNLGLDFLPRQVSILALHWLARLLDCGGDESLIPGRPGATIKNSTRVVNEFGVASNFLWPFVPIRKNTKPPENVFEEAKANSGRMAFFKLNSFDDMVRCLEEGWPFVVGFPVYEDAVRASLITGVINMPEEYDVSYSGHSVLCWGIDDVSHPKHLLIRNSWGKLWGVAGDGKLSIGYLEPPEGQVTHVWKPWTIRPI